MSDRKTNGEVLFSLLKKYSPVDYPGYQRLVASIKLAMSIRKYDLLEMDCEMRGYASDYLGIGQIREGDDSVDIEEVIRWVSHERQMLARWKDDVVASISR